MKILKFPFGTTPRHLVASFQFSCATVGKTAGRLDRAHASPPRQFEVLFVGLKLHYTARLCSIFHTKVLGGHNSYKPKLITAMVVR